MDQLTLTCFTCRQGNRLPLDRLHEAPKCGTCGDPLVPIKPMDIDAGSHDKAIKLDELPLLIDYWAPWCGPCRAMAPEFARVAKTLSGYVRFAKLNTQENQNIANRLRIQGIPLLILYSKGREVARLPGARQAPAILSFVRSHVSGL